MEIVASLVILATATTSAAAGTTRVNLYAEPDLRAEAGAVALLLESRLNGAEVDARGRLTRVGTKLEVVLNLRDPAGKLVGAQIVARSPHGAVGILAATLAKEISAALGMATKQSNASLGELRPFARARDLLSRSKTAAAALALGAGRASVAARVVAAKLTGSRATGSDVGDLAHRANALLASADPAGARELARAELGKDRKNASAAAALVRAELARFDVAAAVSAGKSLPGRSAPIVNLARAELAHRRSESRRRADALATLLKRDPYVPALAMVVELPPGELGARTEKLVVAAAATVAADYPGLAAALGVRAALAGGDIEATLELVDVAELSSVEIRAVAPLIDEAVAAAWPVGLRLRAELRMRRNDLAGALADIERGLATAPRDPRLLRYQARILSEQGDSAAALAALEKIEDPSADAKRELARALSAAGEVDRARAIRRTLADDSSVESRLATAAQMLVDTDAATAVAEYEALLELSPDSPDLLRKLAEAYDAAGRAADAAAARATADALTEERGGKSAAPEAGARVAGVDLADDTDKAKKALLVDLAAELPTLIDAFPTLAGRRVKRVAIAPLEGSREPFYWPRQVRPDQLLAGLTHALSWPPYSFDVVELSETFSRPLSQSRLSRVAAENDVGAVLLYGLRADGSDAKVTFALYEADSRGASEFSDVLPGEKLGLVGWNSTFIGILMAIGSILLLWLLFRVLRGSGQLQVTIKRDAACVDEAFTLVVSRSATPPALRDAKAYAVDTKRAGVQRSRYRATLVGPDTAFDRIPIGWWHVHLIGTYVKGHELRILEGELSKRTRTRRKQLAHVTFDLVPRTTEFHITVYDLGGPQGQAEVWLDGRREHKRMTAADGTAALDVPPGRHVIHVVSRGMQASRAVDVHDTKIHTMSISMERERLLAAAADGIELEGDGEDVEIEHVSMPIADRKGIAATMAAGSQEVAASSDTMLLGAASAPAVNSAATRQDLTGLQRYRPVAELGRGAMGVVYRACDQVLERDVALKVMSEQLRQQPVALKMFMQEAKALAALNHQNVVTVFDQGQDQGQAFMVMEFVEGSTLEDMLVDKERLSIREGIDIGRQICAGLDYAHKRRVIHRDIKPANIFLTSEGTVKIGDFGLARVIHEMRIHQTEVRGTPLYMAPEQIHGVDIDFRVDLYAVGCTLFEVFTGRPPFVDGEILYHHLHTEPPKPSQFLAGIPPLLDATIMACIAKDKENRFRSAAALGASLAKVEAGL